MYKTKNETKNNLVGVDDHINPIKYNNMIMSNDVGVALLGDPKINKIKIKKFKQNSAITLIALVITIVLLILAAVTLNIVLGENGLFGKARQAKIETDKAQAIEDIKLKILEVQADAAQEGRTASLEDLYNRLRDVEGQEYKVTKDAQTATLAVGSLASWENTIKLYIRNMKYSYVVEVGSNLQVENDVQTASGSDNTSGGNTQSTICNHISQDIPNFTPTIKFVNGKYIDVEIPQLNISNSNNIVEYLYLINDIVVGKTEESHYRYDNLDLNTAYTIKVIAIDKYAKVKESSEVNQSTIDKQYYIKDGKPLYEFEKANIQTAQENNSGYLHIETENTASRACYYIDNVDVSNFTKLKCDIEVISSTGTNGLGFGYELIPINENVLTTDADSYTYVDVVMDTQTSKERTIYTATFSNLNNALISFGKNATTNKTKIIYNIYDLWFE